MRKVAFYLLLSLVVLAGSCGKDKEPYFLEGGFVLPQSHGNVVREFFFFGEESPGVADGFDLDEINSIEPHPDTCYVQDMTDNFGRVGIDNQLARIWTDLEPLVGEATEALLHGAINEGKFLLMIELEGVDDLMNDDNVTVHVLRGRLKPNIGTKDLIAPDQTFYADEKFPSSKVENVQIVDGFLEAGPVEFVVPIEILDANFELPVRRGKIRIQIKPDGSFDGLVGGFITASEFLGELLNTGAKTEAELVSPFFEENTDRNRVDGYCTDFSAAFGFSATTAFVVRKTIP